MCMERLENAKTKTSRFDPYDRFLLAVQSVDPKPTRKAFVAMRDNVTTKREAATAKLVEMVASTSEAGAAATSVRELVKELLAEVMLEAYSVGVLVGTVNARRPPPAT